MLQIILKLIGLVLVLAGVIMVYDARILTRNWFSFGDQNEASTGLKILGGIVILIGAFIVYFNK
ncbi:MAG: hypothetical protein HFJ17_04110 [Clostridia bacterium]|nr:hypothetical protein [Clostridia bacterium]